MSRHWSRSIYYVVDIDQEVIEPNYFQNGNSHAHSEKSSIAMRPHRTSEHPVGKFGHMFRDLAAAPKQDDAMIEKLVQLGVEMNKPVAPVASSAQNSVIPAGYTYLGQFIAHEVSFDKTKAPLFNGSTPKSYSSPQIDLDSLYGLGPSKERRLYQDSARLKIGETTSIGEVKRTFLNDLPREGYGRRNPREAVIADPRNDDNLATAQIHVALAKFHNKVVDTLQDGEGFRPACPLHPKGCSPQQLFTCARREVTQHFQAIILYDFLPKILDERGLKCVESRKTCYFDIPDPKELFMPLEFSVAAFRFGHSMVRPFYEWNYLQCSEPFRNGVAQLKDLFQFTHFSGNLGQAPRLRSDWIIDWRRFFDFEVLGYPPDKRHKNFARKIDTAFNLHIDEIHGYPKSGFARGQRSITARNLLRGYSLGLPTGEDVARLIGETPLKAKDVARGPHEELLKDPLFCEKTPLWYYILKEAELNNNGQNSGKLGPVGSLIVAETLVELIKQSPNSIFNEKDWRPRFGDRARDETFDRYEMVDLLDFADVADPVGDFVRPH